MLFILTFYFFFCRKHDPGGADDNPLKTNERKRTARTVEIRKLK